MTANFATLRSQFFTAGTKINARGMAGYAMIPAGSTYGTVAVPDDLETLGNFQGLQRAINTYKSKFGMGGMVDVDGEVGNLTRGGYDAVRVHMQAQGVPAPTYATNGDLARAAKDAALAIAEAGGFTADFTPVPATASPRYQGPRDGADGAPMPGTSPPLARKSKAGLYVAGAAFAGLIWWAASSPKGSGF